MMSRAGSNRTFKEAKEDLNIYAGITVSAKDVERVAGLQVRKSRHGKNTSIYKS